MSVNKNTLDNIVEWMDTSLHTFKNVSADYKHTTENTKKMFAYTTELHRVVKRVMDVSTAYSDRMTETERVALRKEQDDMMLQLRNMQREIEGYNESVQSESDDNNQSTGTPLQQPPVHNDLPPRDNDTQSTQSIQSLQRAKTVADDPKTHRTQSTHNEHTDMWNTPDRDVSARVEDAPSSELPSSSTDRGVSIPTGNTRASASSSDRGSYQSYSEDQDDSSRVSQLESIMNSPLPSSVAHRASTRKDKIQRSKLKERDVQKTTDTEWSSALLSKDQESPLNRRASKQRTVSNTKGEGKQKRSVATILPSQITLMTLPSHFSDAQKRRGKMIPQLVSHA